MSASAFRVRYAAYTLDLALLAPLALLLALAPLQRAKSAIDALAADSVLAMERAFADGHVALLSLAGALRADAGFIAALGDHGAALTAAIGTAFAAVVGAMALWFIGFEASPWQATPGKRLLGLRVERLDGGRPGLGRAALRFIAAAPSWLLLHFGHAMAAWRADGRGLHDLVAGTRVVGAASMPGWAQAFVFAQGLVAFALLAWFGWTLLQALLLLGL
jgi:uncharacterized RDD family membrane protein YckC